MVNWISSAFKGLSKYLIFPKFGWMHQTNIIPKIISLQSLNRASLWTFRSESNARSGVLRIFMKTGFRINCSFFTVIVVDCKKATWRPWECFFFKFRAVSNIKCCLKINYWSKCILNLVWKQITNACITLSIK
jgi:hypothetical protein